MGFIPNSFQHPNLSVDKLMAFLTDPELRCWTYTLRRTLGFHKGSDKISLSQYVHGLVSSQGEILDYGTGLSLSGVVAGLKGLVGLGLMKKVRDNDPFENEGTEYEPVLDEAAVDWERLFARRQTWIEQNIARTAKARAARQAKREALCGTEGEHSVGQTGGPLSDRDTKDQEETQSETQDVTRLRRATDGDLPPQAAHQPEEPSAVAQLGMFGTPAQIERVGTPKRKRGVTPRTADPAPDAPTAPKQAKPRDPREKIITDWWQSQGPGPGRVITNWGTDLKFVRKLIGVTEALGWAEADIARNLQAMYDHFTQHSSEFDRKFYENDLKLFHLVDRLAPWWNNVYRPSQQSTRHAAHTDDDVFDPRLSRGAA